MSIILKGIDLPKEGRLKLEITSDGLVWIDKGKEFYAHKDYASQIPTPHGRLIDASELIKSYMKSTKTDIDDFYDTIDIIDNAPTILEAEE